MGKMNLDLTGKTALITGGSRGLGMAIAKSMVVNGAEVVVCGRKQESLDKAVEDFRNEGLDLVGIAANVGRSEEVKALFEAVNERFGRLDILVNNVGMNILTPSVVGVDEGLWDKIMDTNLKGAYLVSSRAVHLMKKAESGKIINISSTAAKRAAMGMGVYCIAKAGLEMLTKVMAVELARDRINVNAVAPGVVMTKFSRPFWSNESLLKQMESGIPFGRIAKTEDIVGTVMYLASGLSKFVTGEVITVDGGSTAR